MKLNIAKDLEWELLVASLAGYAQTRAGKARCQTLPTDLQPPDIEQGWTAILPLKRLITSGYRPIIGDLPDMEHTFKGAKLGQVLDGESLREVLTLLETTKVIYFFTRDFKEKCKTLERYHGAIYPLPKLIEAIGIAIAPNGDILDDASHELKRIRTTKLSLRKKIEHQIKQLLTDGQMEAYIQDKFFTIRSERYVVPMRLDGRGRIKGSIYDTSDSGQTLYIEPAAIAPLNSELLEMELSEKLEILRIFRELSAHVASEVEILSGNYTNLIDLDFLTAKAGLAHQHDAGVVEIASTPSLNLIQARHPLINNVVANTIALEDGQTTLIISGPNAGGKTVVLKTVGLLQLMLKAGLLIPADEKSQMYLFHDLYISMGDSQSITANLSTFSGHLLSLKPILEKATQKDLVLLDELAVGTEPQTGSAIARAILEDLADKNIVSVTTTHYDTLKGLAISDHRFRNGSMEFSKKSFKPTYYLLLDLPGQSYGIEAARQMGLPERIIERATTLRGKIESSLDTLIESLVAAREETLEEKAKISIQRIELEQQKAHWETERKNLDDLRKSTARKLTEKYDSEINILKDEFHQVLEAMKKLYKQAQKAPSKETPEIRDAFAEGRREADTKLENIRNALAGIEAMRDAPPGVPANASSISHLKIGQRVFVTSLGREVTIASISQGPSASVEVQAGLLKMKVPINRLRLLTKQEANHEATTKPASRYSKKAGGSVDLSSPVVLQRANTLDLRGQDVETALKNSWLFIDKALLRGENTIVIVHGHGTDKLKQSLRTALAKDAPYELDFRPGETSEGGDGVTIVYLRC